MCFVYLQIYSKVDIYMHITGLYTSDIPGNRTSSKSSHLKYLVMKEEYLRPDRFLLSTGRTVGCRKKKQNPKKGLHLFCNPCRSYNHSYLCSTRSSSVSWGNNPRNSGSKTNREKEDSFLSIALNQDTLNLCLFVCKHYFIFFRWKLCLVL